MTRTFAERDPVKLGVIGTVVLVTAVAGAFLVPTAIGGRQFVAEFAEVGGLGGGDPVVVSGLKVGTVDGVALDGDRVDVTFSVTDDKVRLGDSTSAAIKAETALGRKELALAPAGGGELRRIPLDRTTVPYDVTDALSDVTTQVSQVDTGKVSSALDTLSETFKDTPPQVKAVLDGLSRLSQTVSSRDVALRDLLLHADNVSGVLAQRNDQLVKILAQGSSLLAQLNQRGAAIRSLLTNSVAVSDQLSGLVADNKGRLDPALKQLDDLLAVLQQNRNNLDQVLDRTGPLVREIGEAVGSGPFVETQVGNLVPTNLVPLLPELLARGGK
ncbi:MCE family protein [Kutzneria kofuensis]|uniref:Phospholipid/cholesterol/gamma-HCH transport system substrate-binding protein n=1 Tax=Kutzneria kofuensis TaxID=103725 RepID=A0A7W9NJ32_9PSEU|nr:MCE family protein [Kutzneria kofuensis]MBB5893723.1 phospholipid/cholesterol/gamma-HCH transport system substrate-binding protein [Kutzneria kofuensis]